MTLSRLLPFALLALAACVSTAPRIQLPTKVEANCENRAVKQTAIDAIVASTDDRVVGTRYPGDKVLKKVIQSIGGGFAYWPDQPLHLPDTAKAIGVSGDYVTLKRAVITNQIDKAAHSRPIWFTLASPKGDVIVLERAYDIQNICIEGQREA
ncbi:MAG: hypothetical protein NVS3B7_17010 [Candidatus Elarobacter sp.]